MSQKKLENVACFVFARKDSSRIKNKMLRPFSDSCLLDICLSKIAQSKRLKPQQCWLSAYEPEIIEIGKKHQWQIWKRSQESLDDHASISIVADFVHSFKQPYIFSILATNPLTTIETIDNALDTFLSEPKHDGLISVVKETKVFMKKNGQLVQDYYGKPQMFDSKKIEPLYVNSSAFFIWNRALAQKKDLLFNSPLIHEIPMDESFDIDYPFEFEVAEELYKKRNAK